MRSKLQCGWQVGNEDLTAAPHLRHKHAMWVFRGAGVCECLSLSFLFLIGSLSSALAEPPTPSDLGRVKILAAEVRQRSLGQDLHLIVGVRETSIYKKFVLRVTTSHEGRAVANTYKPSWDSDSPSPSSSLQYLGSQADVALIGVILRRIPLPIHDLSELDLEVEMFEVRQPAPPEWRSLDGIPSIVRFTTHELSGLSLESMLNASQTCAHTLAAHGLLAHLMD